MPTAADTSNLALFCDFENIALGVRDARYDKFLEALAMSMTARSSS